MAFTKKQWEEWKRKNPEKWEERRRKLSTAHRDKVLSSDHREKIAKSMRGRKKTEEHKRKIRETLRRRFENKPSKRIPTIKIPKLYKDFKFKLPTREILVSLTLVVLVLIVLNNQYFYSGLAVYQKTDWENHTSITLDKSMEKASLHIVFGNYKSTDCKEEVFVTDGENNISFDVINTIYEDGLCSEADIVFSNPIYKPCPATCGESTCDQCYSKEFENQTIWQQDCVANYCGESTDFECKSQTIVQACDPNIKCENYKVIVNETTGAFWLECNNQTSSNESGSITGSALYGQKTTKTFYVYYGKKPEIQFDRDPQCEKCGKHKVPPETDVNMTISAATDYLIENATFSDYYPNTWNVVNPNDGTITSYNDTYNKIEWHVGDVKEKVEKWYIIHSPERTLPPTEYYFQSELNEAKSDWWQIIVADPAISYFDDQVIAPCTTTKDRVTEGCTPANNMTAGTAVNVSFHMFGDNTGRYAQGWLTVLVKYGNNTTTSNDANTNLTQGTCTGTNNFSISNGYCLNVSTGWSCSWSSTTKNFNFSNANQNYPDFNVSYEIVPCTGSKTVGWKWDVSQQRNQSSGSWGTITIPRDSVEAWGVNNTAPKWWTPSINDTSPVNPQSAIRHNVNWTDDAELSTYKLEWNATVSGSSCTGGFSNVSEGSLSGTSQWNNITQTLPAACNNTVISWRQFVNDTHNVWNKTDYQNYTIRPYGWLNVTLTDPSSAYQTPSNPKTVNRYSYFQINATIQCQGSTNAVCGLVNGTARYNSSGTTANTNISTTSGTEPFYTTNTQPQRCGSILYQGNSCLLNWTTNATATWGSRWAVDVNFNSTNYSAQISQNNTTDAYIDISNPAPQYSHQSQNDTIMENVINNLSSNWSDSTPYLDLSWLETNETGNLRNYTDLLTRNYNYSEEGDGSGDDKAYWNNSAVSMPDVSQGTEFTTQQYYNVSLRDINYVNHTASGGFPPRLVFHRFVFPIEEYEGNVTNIIINWRGKSGTVMFSSGPLSIYAMNWTSGSYVLVNETWMQGIEKDLSINIKDSLDDYIGATGIPGGVDIEVYCEPQTSGNCFLATNYMSLDIYYNKYYSSPQRHANHTQKWSNFTWINNSIAAGTTISWRTCTNDSAPISKVNCTPYMNFTYTLNPPPQYSNLGQSNDEIVEDTVNYLWSNWSDPSYYLDWAWLATNETGNYVNYTNTTIQQETVDEAAYNNTSVTDIPENSEGTAIADLTNITSDDSVYVNTSRTTMDGIWVLHQFNFSNIQNVDDVANMTIFWNGITNATNVGSASFPLYIYNYVTGSYQLLNQTAADNGNEVNITGTVSSDMYKYIQNGKAKFKVYSVYNATETDVVYLATDYVYLNVTRGEYHTSPRNLRYNTTAKTNFTWNNTSVTGGTKVCWKIYANDSANKTNVTSPEQCFNVTTGNLPPQWSQNDTSVANNSQYRPGRNYGFEVNWTDPDTGIGGVSQGLFFTNLSGSNITYNKTSTPAVENNTAGIYWINFTDRAAGTYFFQWKANDTSDAWNTSDTWIYVIAKNTSGVMRLWLNDTEDNKSYVQGEVANFTAKLNLSSKTIYLNSSYPGWVLQSDTDSDIINYTVLGSMGDNYNLTAYWNGDVNYTSSSKTYFFNVTTNCLPPDSGSWTIQTTDNIICQDKLINLDGNLSIYGNLTFVGNVTLKMGLVTNGISNITVYDSGNFTIRNQSNVTTNNTDYRFAFVVESGSKFEMNSSALSYCGYGMEATGPNKSTGLIINTSYNTIVNSTFSKNYVGIVIRNASNITNNSFNNNSYAGIWSYTYSNITNNTLLNESYGIVIGAVGVSQSNPDYYNNNISLNNISNSTIGIYGSNAAVGTIYRNTIKNCSQYGIDFYIPGNNTILNNSLLDNRDGIRIYYGGNQTIENNTLNSSNISVYFFILSTSPAANFDSMIKSNVISNGTYGVYIYNSGNTSVRNNTIKNIYDSGIRVINSSSTIYNNTIYNNADGIITYDGISVNVTDDNNISFNTRIGVISIDSNTSINSTQVENNTNGKVIFAWSTAAHTITSTGSNLASAYVEARNVSAIPASYNYSEYYTSIPSFTTDGGGWTIEFLVYQNRTNNDSTTTDFNDHTFFANKTGVGSGKNITTMNESKTITINVTTHAPVVSNVFVDDDTLPLNNISLYGGTSRNVKCNATITDEEGWWDVNVSNVTFFDMAYQWNSPNDNSTHYYNSSCTLSGGVGISSTINAECIMPIWYYANSTFWNCNMTVNDTFNNVSWDNDTNYIDALLAVGVNATLQFGTVDSGQISANDVNDSITNYGNTRMDLQLNGSDMSCTYYGPLPVGLEKYNCTAFGQDYNTRMANLTTTPDGGYCTEFDLIKQINLAESMKNVSWKIQVPGTGVGGVCTGTIWFTAVSG